MNSNFHPETQQRNTLVGLVQAKNERLMAKVHKLETELRQIRKLCLEEYANNPENSTLNCVSQTLLALRTK